jgi:hypothetical protein
MKNEHVMVTETEHRRFCFSKSISWTAVIAGTLIALGLNFLLSLFGFAIGLSAFSTTKEGLVSLAIGGFIGFIIIAFVSMFVAGWAAGYIGRQHYVYNPGLPYNRNYGMIYGFMTWSLSLIVMIVLAGEVNNFVTNYQYRITHPTSVLFESPNNPDASVAMGDRTRAGANATRGQGTVVVDEEKAAHILGLSLFSMFVIFLVGAVASAIGGIFGFKLRDERL